MAESDYHITTWSLEILLAIEMNIIREKIDKPMSLYLSILEIIKTILYEIWYDYIKPKYGNEF